ncbi:MAG: LemA family protein [Patescibacteria group bacterium]
MATKNKFPAWAWLLGIVVLIAIWGVSTYNGLITSEGVVDSAWAQVETQYQRRADLVPQLVATTQGAADFEQSTLTAVTEARTQWQDTANDPNASLEQQIAASNSFDSALSRLLVTVEAYPTLTATENFQTLQSQLEGTENRISVARMDFNDAAKNYNVKVRRVPTNIIASIFGFETKPFFEAAEGSEDAPTVEFDFDE